MTHKLMIHKVIIEGSPVYCAEKISAGSVVQILEHDVDLTVNNFVTFKDGPFDQYSGSFNNYRLIFLPEEMFSWTSLRKRMKGFTSNPIQNDIALQVRVLRSQPQSARGRTRFGYKNSGV